MTDHVLAILIAVIFLFSGAVKILGVPQSVAVRDHLGISPGLWRTVGALEWLGVTGLVVGTRVPILGTLALVGLAFLMVGAMTSRLRVRDAAWAIAMDVVVFGLVVVALVRHLP
jgi:hypothetical protein